MRRSELISHIKSKSSFLCVGLDPDPTKIPSSLSQEKEPILAFNKAIIDATADYCVAYKPNIAFYESLGNRGWDILGATLELIPKDCLSIADAKRGDIGNTAAMYAKTFFQTYLFDAITIAPYMGEDSVKPFLNFKDKWSIVLGLTSNPGSADFQLQKLADGRDVFEAVLEIVATWGTDENLMFVIGATHAEMFKLVRKYLPTNFLLVPGVGAQGGDLDAICRYGMIDDVGLLINASRSILYADTGRDFAQSARDEAMAIQTRMDRHLQKLK